MRIKRVEVSPRRKIIISSDSILYQDIDITAPPAINGNPLKFKEVDSLQEEQSIPEFDQKLVKEDSLNSISDSKFEFTDIIGIKSPREDIIDGENPNTFKKKDTPNKNNNFRENSRDKSARKKSPNPLNPLQNKGFFDFTTNNTNDHLRSPSSSPVSSKLKILKK